MWQNRRSLAPEILDLSPPSYTKGEYDTCLRLLGRVNRFLGGFQATKNAIQNLKMRPHSILDVGCGGGYLCQFLSNLYPDVKMTGIDISKEAIEHAQKNGLKKENISFYVQNSKSLDYSDQSFDLVTTTLVCHHMTDEELVAFLQESYRVASSAVIINDLHRHLLAYVSFALIAPIAFPSRLINHDGKLSIKRSFRRGDWLMLLKKAGFKKNQYILKWHFPFRWTLTLIKS